MSKNHMFHHSYLGSPIVGRRQLREDPTWWIEVSFPVKSKQHIKLIYGRSSTCVMERVMSLPQPSRYPLCVSVAKNSFYQQTLLSAGGSAAFKCADAKYWIGRDLSTMAFLNQTLPAYLLLRGVARFFHKVRGSKPRNLSRAEVVSEVLNVQKFREQLVEAKTLPKFREDIPGPGVLSRSSEAFLLPQVARGISERSEPRRRPQLVKGFLAG